MMGRTDSALQQAVYSSFIVEASALKPGNVSDYAAGHGMTVKDFYHSAELTTPILCDPALSVGERIQHSVEVTMEQVGCNTNLGMLLLFAPLIRAAESTTGNIEQLKTGLVSVLKSLDASEAGRVCAAICLARPAGLGLSNKYDVHTNINSGLLEVMAEAQDRDSIARQYTTDFNDVFSIGLINIKDFTSRWNSVKWATVACYMTFLASIPDSHIRRKYGEDVAEQIKTKTIPRAEQFKNNDNPDNAVNVLLEYDKELKDSQINPGTSADLTAASLLVYKLIDNGC